MKPLQPLAYPRIDDLIRNGEHSLGRETLLKALSEHPKRLHWEELASYSRRLGVPELGIQLLAPLVRPRARKPIETDDAERGEYAGCLVRMGVLSEGRNLLKTVNAQKYPRKYLFEAFAYMAEWDFKNSEHVLLEFLTQADRGTNQKGLIDPYETLIAQVNLAVGFVFRQEFEKSLTLIDDLLKTTGEQKYFLLHSDLLHIKAQTHIDLKEWKKASSTLDLAEKSLTDSQTFDALLIKIERALLNLKKDPSKNSLAHVNAVKKEAEARGFYENARDCVFQIAIVTQNQKLLTQALYGTPYHHYRQAMLARAGLREKDFPTQYILGSHKSSSKNSSLLNLTTGESAFKFNQVPHRMLKALGQDFFKPTRVVDLFSQVFPEQYYSASAADRVHQGLKRLRQILKKEKLDLKIEEKAGHFTLAPGATRIVIEAPWIAPQIREIKPLLEIKKYVEAFETRGNHFHLKKFASVHGLSDRTASRILKNAVERGFIVKNGGGRSTFYSRKNHKRGTDLR